MSTNAYQKIEPKTPDFKDNKVKLAYIAVFVGFLIVVLSVFLPLFKESGIDGTKSFSAFKLAIGSVKDTSDLIKTLKASGDSGMLAPLALCTVDLLGIIVCIMTLINVIINIVRLIKKNRMPCNGVPAITGLMSITLVFYMTAISKNGAGFSTKIGAGIFIMIVGMLISSIGSRLLNDYVVKLPKKEKLLRLSALLIPAILFIAVLCAMPSGIASEDGFVCACDALAFDSEMNYPIYLITLVISQFLLVLAVMLSAGAVSSSVNAADDELFRGRVQLDQRNNLPLDYTSHIPGIIISSVVSILSFVLAKVAVASIDKEIVTLGVSGGMIAILAAGCVCFVASIVFKVILKKSKTPEEQK